MNTGGGGGGGLINFPPLKRGRLLERGGLNRGFTVRVFICNFVRIFVILNFSIKKKNETGSDFLIQTLQFFLSFLRFSYLKTLFNDTLDGSLSLTLLAANAM